MIEIQSIIYNYILIINDTCWYIKWAWSGLTGQGLACQVRSVPWPARPTGLRQPWIKRYKEALYLNSTPMIPTTSNETQCEPLFPIIGSSRVGYCSSRYSGPSNDTTTRLEKTSQMQWAWGLRRITGASGYRWWRVRWSLTIVKHS